MKGLYKMNLDFGRSGDLQGVFIADTEDIKYLTNNKISVYFGEVLGKHSEISCCINGNDLKLVTTDKNVINIVRECELETGYNPLAYNICDYETDGIPENGIEWGDCTVQEYIDFMRKGIVPQFYKKDYENWLNNQKEK